MNKVSCSANSRVEVQTTDLVSLSFDGDSGSTINNPFGTEVTYRQVIPESFLGYVQAFTVVIEHQPTSIQVVFGTRG
ncbi:hypothetical protein D3C78_1663220 [compost metagenome]